MSRRPQRHSCGFTLIELLVVVAIIGALLTLMLPAIQASRGAAWRATCQSNLRQLAIGAHTYHDAHGRFPAGVQQTFFSAAPVYRGTSLFVHLLPYIEQRGLYAAWDFAEPLANTQGGMQARTATVLETLVCPADSIERNPVFDVYYFALTSYGGNGGMISYLPQQATTDGVFHTAGAASDPVANQRAVRLRELTDGASSTILFGERSHADPGVESFVPAGWTTSLSIWGAWAPSQGRKAVGHVTMSAQAPINYRLAFTYQTRLKASPPVTSSAQLQAYIQRRLAAWGSNHAGGANLALADGSVRFVNDDLPMNILAALSTRAGGEFAEMDTNQ